MKVRFFLIVGLLICLNWQFSFSQFNSVNFNLSVSNHIDGNYDDEFDYETIFGGVLAVWSIGYAHQVKSNFTIAPLVGFSHANIRYTNLQRSSSAGSIDDRTFVNKSQVSLYATTGCGFSYWAFNVGHGVVLKSELYVHFLLDSKRDVVKKLDLNPTEFYTINTSEKLKKVVPSFKVGPEFSLRLGKRIAVNIGLFIDIRASGFYKESFNTSYVNKGFQVGFRYITNG